MDINKLLKALDNDTNEELFHYTFKKIKEMNFNILKELHLPKDVLVDYMNKIEGYRYVDGLDEFKVGYHIRWINITNPNHLILTKGATLCEIKITDNGVMLVCKSFGFMPKFFQIKMDECLVFQKINDEQKVLLSALEYLSK